MKVLPDGRKVRNCIQCIIACVDNHIIPQCNIWDKKRVTGKYYDTTHPDCPLSDVEGDEE